MQFLTLLILLALFVPLAFLFIRRVFPVIIRKKATAMLDNILFPNGLQQKQEEIKTFHNITNHRFNNEELLDFYYKIKGLHTIKINHNTNFWLKKYLLTTSIIKLNYFEQLRFYETFLNFPQNPNKKQQRFNYNPVKEKIKTKSNAPAGKTIPQK